MATKTARSRASIYALVQTKAKQQPLIGWDRAWGDSQTQSALDEVLLEMESQGLITLATVKYRSHYSAVTVESEVDATPEDLCGPLRSGNDRANAALWLWLLTHGGEVGSYGSDYPWGDSGEIAHLFLCGLNLTESTAVRDTVWTEWNGTFADGNRKTGVSGEATCNCEDVLNYPVHAEVDSITDLLRQILGVA